MSLEERRNRSDLIEMFKISRGVSAIPWNSFFRADSNERIRGHSRKLAKDSFRLDVRKYFFSQRIVKKWNSLSEEVISAGSVNIQEKVGRTEKDEEGFTYGLMSAGTKADSEGTLVRPNQVNDQVNEIQISKDVHRTEENRKRAR
jgi:hypothetical protein